jgi:hypothetical protein
MKLPTKNLRNRLLKLLQKLLPAQRSKVKPRKRDKPKLQPQQSLHLREEKNDRGHENKNNKLSKCKRLNKQRPSKSK